MHNDLDLQQLTFSLQYDATDFASLLPAVHVTGEEETEGTVQIRRTRYALPDGLEITRTVRLYPDFDAMEQVLFFNNNSDQKSGLITGLMDIDQVLAFAGDPAAVPGWRPGSAQTRIISTTGSDCTRKEFYPEERVIRNGQSVCYSPSGGRSSSQLAPFFDIRQERQGWLFAIGWTGQWQACMSRTEDGIRLQAGVKGAAFRLLPGEQLRTASCLLLPYRNGRTAAHNTFRRLIRQHFSLIGQPDRPEQGPFCSMSWGSVPSDSMVDRIERMARERFGYEYFWIDAAWYGASDGYCPSEFEGDWYTQTGNWQVNPKTHPDGLRDVSAALQKQGMKMLLWIEPERAISSNPLPQQHPEWFLRLPGDTGTEPDRNWLLNLGCPEALAYAIDLVSALIRDLQLGCYRQDFNCDPLPFWQAHDEPDRRGITQIKHIMGLYTFWDTLLERFPGLIIDNCSSGGRRIDIETLQRSMPLWRSDYQCVWDYEPEVSQMHSMGFADWLPWSGTGVGRVMGDTYRFRSSYGSSLVMSYWGYEDRMIDDSQPLEWVRRTNAEYKRVRPYFSADYYPLTALPEGDGSWVAWQYDRPDQSDGIIQVFRQPRSPCETARLELGGLADNLIYAFEDADTGETVQIASETLARDGLLVHLPHKRSSRLLFYTCREIVR